MGKTSLFTSVARLTLSQTFIMALQESFNFIFPTVLILIL